MSVYMQEYEENPSLLYSTAHPRGVIQPYSTEQIPLILQAKTVGQVQCTAFIAILGQQDPLLVRMCVYVCTRIEFETAQQAKRLDQCLFYAHSVFYYFCKTTN